MEYGEVECQPEADGVCWLQFRLGNIECILICLAGVVHNPWVGKGGGRGGVTAVVLFLEMCIDMMMCG